MINVTSGMKPNSPLFKALSTETQAQAVRVARLLQGQLDSERFPYESPVGSCGKCKARLENPHADYHLAPLIDDSKI